MADCGSNGTQIPWFFQWNTDGKNSGSFLNASFADPKYTVISSPYSGVRNVSDLSSNDCYFPNTDGGIDTAQCSNTQQMAWFGYATTVRPQIRDEFLGRIHSQSAPCNALKGNKNLETYACELISHGYSIRPPSDGKGRIAHGQKLVEVSGIIAPDKYPPSISFSIIPNQPATASETAGIAKLSGTIPKGQSQVVFLLGLAPGSTKLEFFNSVYSLNITTTKSLPLNKETKVKVVLNEHRVKKDYYYLRVKIFFDDQKVDDEFSSIKFKWRGMELYQWGSMQFSSPPR